MSTGISIAQQRYLLVDNAQRVGLVHQLRTILRSWNCDDLIEVNNAREAVQVLMEVSMDVVICDIDSEPVDGIKLVRLIRDKMPDCPNKDVIFVLLTDHGHLARVPEAREAGAKGFVLKPVEGSQLKTVLKKVLDERWKEMHADFENADIPRPAFLGAGREDGVPEIGDDGLDLNAFDRPKKQAEAEEEEAEKPDEEEKKEEKADKKTKPETDKKAPPKKKISANVGSVKPRSGRKEDGAPDAAPSVTRAAALMVGGEKGPPQAPAAAAWNLEEMGPPAPGAPMAPPRPMQVGQQDWGGAPQAPPAESFVPQPVHQPQSPADLAAAAQAEASAAEALQRAAATMQNISSQFPSFDQGAPTPQAAPPPQQPIHPQAPPPPPPPPMDQAAYAPPPPPPPPPPMADPFPAQAAPPPPMPEAAPPPAAATAPPPSPEPVVPQPAPPPAPEPIAAQPEPATAPLPTPEPVAPAPEPAPPPIPEPVAAAPEPPPPPPVPEPVKPVEEPPAPPPVPEPVAAKPEEPPAPPPIPEPVAAAPEPEPPIQEPAPEPPTPPEPETAAPEPPAPEPPLAPEPPTPPPSEPETAAPEPPAPEAPLAPEPPTPEPAPPPPQSETGAPAARSQQDLLAALMGGSAPPPPAPPPPQAPQLGWRPEYAIGDGAIDGANQQLLQMAGQVAKDGGSPAGMAQLQTQMTAHFQNEEARWQELGSPFLSMQREEHQRLLGELAKIASGQGDYANWVQTRLIKHCSEFDAQALMATQFRWS